jgi:hypothetical protein
MAGVGGYLPSNHEALTSIFNITKIKIKSRPFSLSDVGEPQAYGVPWRKGPGNHLQVLSHPRQLSCRQCHRGSYLEKSGNFLVTHI